MKKELILELIKRKRKERSDYSENMIRELNIENLDNLYKRSIRELEDFLDLFNLEKNELINSDLLDPSGVHEKKIVFTEICFLNRISA